MVERRSSIAIIAVGAILVIMALALHAIGISGMIIGTVGVLVVLAGALSLKI